LNCSARCENATEKVLFAFNALEIWITEAFRVGNLDRSAQSAKACTEPQWSYASTFAILTAIFFVQYGSIINLYGYKKPEPGKNGAVVQTLILEGRKLRPEAAKKLKELQANNSGIQALLEGAGFNVNILWTRAELEWVRKRAVVYFILLLVVGTSALTVAGFATQL
jgi:hypothetical protein